MGWGKGLQKGKLVKLSTGYLVTSSLVEKNAAVSMFFFNLGEPTKHPSIGNTQRSEIIKKKDDGWGCNEVKCRRWLRF